MPTRMCYDGGSTLPTFLHALLAFSRSSSRSMRRRPEKAEQHIQPRSARIIRAIMAGTAPADLTVTAHAAGLPYSWAGLKIDDSSFIDALLNHEVTVHAIDRKRVFAAGWSNGAQLAYRPALEHPEDFAGVATISAITEGQGAPRANARTRELRNRPTCSASSCTRGTGPELPHACQRPTPWLPFS
jgi:hypothetical protein